MKKTAFTICAKNYLGLAQVLENTIKLYNNDIDFYIFIADEFISNEALPKNVIISKEQLNISEELWKDLSFKYDLTEFCTAIKPFCFSYLFNLNENKAICLYFDPDIAVFNSLNSIYNCLLTSSIFLTPHITTIEKKYTGPLKENKFLYSGVFNLGFIGMRSDTISLYVLEWWKERLTYGCFKSQYENYFTDQKWIDFLPVLCPQGLHISFDLGNNLAPWNFYERRLVFKDNRYFLVNRIKQTDSTIYHQLNFVHFSGYDYASLMSGNVVQNNIAEFNYPDDLSVLFYEYKKLLEMSNFIKYSNMKYSYNYFSNGDSIHEIHRRIYRRLIEDFNFLDNPFESNNIYYKKIKRAKLFFKTHQKGSIQNESTSTSQKIIILNNYLFKLIYKIVGPKIYFNLLKIIRRYSILENQLFLVDKGYIKNTRLRK